MMKDMPRIRFKEHDYTDEIDEIFESLGVEEITFGDKVIDTVEDQKKKMLEHPHCNDILGLLKEFCELRNRGDCDAWYKIEGISKILMQVESPILVVVDNDRDEFYGYIPRHM